MENTLKIAEEINQRIADADKQRIADNLKYLDTVVSEFEEWFGEDNLQKIAEDGIKYEKYARPDAVVGVVLYRIQPATIFRKERRIATFIGREGIVSGHMTPDLLFMQLAKTLVF